MPGEDCGSHERFWILAGRDALEEASGGCIGGGPRSDRRIVGGRHAVANHQNRERRSRKQGDSVFVLPVDQTAIGDGGKLGPEIELAPAERSTGSRVGISNGSSDRRAARLTKPVLKIDRVAAYGTVQRHVRIRTA